jgi:hypothetical protein
VAFVVINAETAPAPFANNHWSLLGLEPEVKGLPSTTAPRSLKYIPVGALLLEVTQLST